MRGCSGWKKIKAENKFDAELIISDQRAHTVVNDWMTGLFGFSEAFATYRREPWRLLCVSAPLSFPSAGGSTGASFAVISER